MYAFNPTGGTLDDGEEFQIQITPQQVKFNV